MLVYTVIVTFNSIKWIELVLNSLHNSIIKTDVVIVDNGSTDGTISLIEKKYTSVILIKSTENLGFSKANNIGIEISLKNKADYVFILNHDAWVLEDTLDTLIKIAIKNKEYGILSPLHLNGKGDKLDENFSHYAGPKFCKNLINDFYLGHKLKEIYESKFVNAAAWLVTRKCLEKVGGFNPLFQMYGEDDNYVQRLRYHGFKLGIVPNCKIFHDREARALSFYKKNNFENFKRATLLKYSDPNNSNKITREYRFICREIIKKIIKLNLSQVILELKKFSFILKNLNHIKRNQKLSIKSHTAFIKLKKNIK